MEATDQLVGPLTNSKWLTHLLMLAVSNMSNEMIFGRRLEYDEDLAVSLAHLPYFQLSAYKYNSLFLFKVNNFSILFLCKQSYVYMYVSIGLIALHYILCRYLINILKFVFSFYLGM